MIRTIRFKAPAARVLLAVGTLAWPFAGGAAADPVVVISNFQGNSYGGAGFTGAPPDTMGAAGLNHFVEFTNGNFSVYSKTGGVPVQQMSDVTFWNNAFANNAATAYRPPGSLSDTRLVFDTNTQRFFASEVTAARDAGGNVVAPNHIMIARSDTADPTGTWRATEFTAGDANTFADFDTLGIDAKGLYFAANNGNPAGNLTGTVSLYSVPKADLLSATPTTANLSRFTNQDAYTRGFTLQAAQNFGPARATHPVLAIDAATALGSQSTGTYTTSTTLLRSSLSNTDTAAATLNGPNPITVAPYAAPGQGHQPDGTNNLDTGDARFGSAVKQVGNILWAVQHISATGTVGGHAILRWYKIDEPTNTVLQSGEIGVNDADHDYYYPSIAATERGDVVIGFTRSSVPTPPTGGPEFPSAYAVVGASAGGPTGATTFGTPLLLKAGESNYHLMSSPGAERFGDYSATSLDPSDPYTLWTVQEYASANNTWATQVAAITVPEPLALPWLVAGGYLLARRRQSRERSG